MEELRTIPMTVITAVPRYWAFWLRWINWPVVRLSIRLGRPVRPIRSLQRLSFISFAHWTVFRKVSRRRMPEVYVVFQTNYNRGDAEYIEAFSHVVPGAMSAIWGRAYGVPPPKPVAPFLQYIRDHEERHGHFYCAYPDASTRQILAALELGREHQAFAARAPGLTPDDFAKEWREWLARAQRQL